MNKVLRTLMIITASCFLAGMSFLPASAAGMVVNEPDQAAILNPATEASDAPGVLAADQAAIKVRLSMDVFGGLGGDSQLTCMVSAA